jgi:hypothetical protein
MRLLVIRSRPIPCDRKIREFGVVPEFRIPVVVGVDPFVRTPASSNNLWGDERARADTPAAGWCGGRLRRRIGGGLGVFAAFNGPDWQAGSPGRSPKS